MADRVLIALIMITLRLVMSKPVTNSMWYQNGGVWCHKCPPGFHVDQHCTENSTNSSCTPCEMKPYNTYSGIWTLSKECVYCTICDPGDKMKVLDACKPTSDTTCTCLEGYVLRGSIQPYCGRDYSLTTAQVQSSSTTSMTDHTTNMLEIGNTGPTIIITTTSKTNNTENQPELIENTDDKIIVPVVVCVLGAVVVVVVVVLVCVYRIIRNQKRYDMVPQNEPIELKDMNKLTTGSL